MKVNWKDFAQRRKLSLDMFENMPYKNYVDWCTQRQVIPIPEPQYPRVPADPASTTAVTQEVTIDEKRLKKLKKSELIELCEENNISFDVTDTKKILINKLVLVNN